MLPQTFVQSEAFISPLERDALRGARACRRRVSLRTLATGHQLARPDVLELSTGVLARGQRRLLTPIWRAALEHAVFRIVAGCREYLPSITPLPSRVFARVT
jgi:hypothetical protein